MTKDDDTKIIQILSENWSDTSRKAYLSGGQVLINFHLSGVCKFEHCPVHNPSDHAYRDLPLHFLNNTYMVRVSDKFEHGLMIDPDDAMLTEAVLRGDKRLIVRNSAYCTTCDEIVESTEVNEMSRCTGKHVTVAGGTKYIRRVFGNEMVEQTIDTSIIINLG